MCVFFLNGTQSHARPRVAFQILLSLFVAVILDNLELDEDLKKLKQVGGRRRFRILKTRNKKRIKKKKNVHVLSVL